MIKISDLTKVFHQQKVLCKINLELSESVIYGLVGPNGCGKTTLMRCICGFTRPTSGSVTVLGKVIGKDCDFAPSTGIIIETPGFLPHYSARRNLAILAGISGKADKARIDEVIHLVGLDPNDKKPVGKYSLGMRQRLGIAQAIMENPQILILDEPFNGLDKQGVADIHALLQDLKAQGKCILLASHSAADIAQACDIVYELNEGKFGQQQKADLTQHIIHRGQFHIGKLAPVGLYCGALGSIKAYDLLQ